MNLSHPTYQYGACFLTEHDDGTLTVDRADPRMLVSARFLEAIATGRPRAGQVAGITLTGHTERIERLGQGEHYPDGPDMVLTINATNRKVIYRIREYRLEPDAYVAEWPD